MIEWQVRRADSLQQRHARVAIPWAGGGMLEIGLGPDAQRTLGAAISDGAAVPAQQARAASLQRRIVVTGIGLAALARLLASHRFLAYVITGAIGLAAARTFLSRTGLASLRASLPGTNVGTCATSG